MMLKTSWARAEFLARGGTEEYPSDPTDMLTQVVKLTAGYLPGRPTTTYTMTKEIAKRAGWIRPGSAWDNTPAQCLRAAGFRTAVDIVDPSVRSGFYDVDEVPFSSGPQTPALGVISVEMPALAAHDPEVEDAEADRPFDDPIKNGNPEKAPVATGQAEKGTETPPEGVPDVVKDGDLVWAFGGKGKIVVCRVVGVSDAGVVIRSLKLGKTKTVTLGELQDAAREAMTGTEKAVVVDAPVAEEKRSPVAMTEGQHPAVIEILKQNRAEWKLPEVGLMEWMRAALAVKHLREAPPPSVVTLQNLLRMQYKNFLGAAGLSEADAAKARSRWNAIVKECDGLVTLLTQKGAAK